MVAQCRDERPIGFQEVLRGKLCRRDPLQGLRVERARLPKVALDDPQRELHIMLLVGVGDAHEGPRRDDLDAELLAQLARQRVALALARSHLAAREFPAPRENLAGGALRNEHAAGTIEERGGHDGDEGPGPACLHRQLGPYSTLESAPWQCLYFLPEPQGQGSLRPTLRSLRTKVPARSGGGSGAGLAGGAPPAAA